MVETTKNGIGCDGWFTSPEWQQAVSRRLERLSLFTKLHQTVPAFRTVYIDVLIKPYANIFARRREIRADEITKDQWWQLLHGVGASPQEIRTVLSKLGFDPWYTPLGDPSVRKLIRT